MKVLAVQGAWHGPLGGQILVGVAAGEGAGQPIRECWMVAVVLTLFEGKDELLLVPPLFVY